MEGPHLSGWGLQPFWREGAEYWVVADQATFRYSWMRPGVGAEYSAVGADQDKRGPMLTVCVSHSLPPHRSARPEGAEYSAVSSDQGK